MVTTERASELQRKLLEWFDRYGRHDLPWQQPSSAYRVWLSEIMLQQTQVKTVIPYFIKFTERFPDVITLAAADLNEVMPYWAGLGYYARARNLHRAARIIVDEHNGELPSSIDALVALPGIGKSTAHAILSSVWQQPLAILDGNVKRVLSRLFAFDQPINTTQGEKSLWQLAQHLMPSQRAGDYTQAIMDLGATCCTRRQPDCLICPWQAACQSYHHYDPHDFPIKQKKAAIPTHDVTFYLIHDDGQVLLQKRPERGLWGGLWSLPGDLAQVCTPPLSPPPTNHCLQPLADFRHTFSHFHLDISTVVCLPWQGMTDDSSLLWVASESIDSLGLPRPIQKILTTWQRQAICA